VVPQESLVVYVLLQFLSLFKLQERRAFGASTSHACGGLLAVPVRMLPPVRAVESDVGPTYLGLFTCLIQGVISLRGVIEAPKDAVCIVFQVVK
jgi:hypothetical protein